MCPRTPFNRWSKVEIQRKELYEEEVQMTYLGVLSQANLDRMNGFCVQLLEEEVYPANIDVPSDEGRGDVGRLSFASMDDVTRTCPSLQALSDRPIMDRPMSSRTDSTRLSIGDSTSSGRPLSPEPPPLKETWSFRAYTKVHWLERGGQGGAGITPPRTPPCGVPIPPTKTTSSSIPKPVRTLGTWGAAPQVLRRNPLPPPWLPKVAA